MTATDSFPGRPFQLRIVGSYLGSDAPANSSLVAWETWIDKLAFSPTYSGNDASSWATSVAGVPVGSGGPSGFDFRNGNTFLLGSGQRWVGHLPDGTSPPADVFGWADYEMLGYAEAHDYVDLPAISGVGGSGPWIASAGSWRRSTAYVFSQASNPQWRKAIPFVYSAATGGWKRI